MLHSDKSRLINSRLNETTLVIFNKMRYCGLLTLLKFPPRRGFAGKESVEIPMFAHRTTSSVQPVDLALGLSWDVRGVESENGSPRLCRSMGTPCPLPPICPHTPCRWPCAPTAGMGQSRPLCLGLREEFKRLEERESSLQQASWRTLQQRPKNLYTVDTARTKCPPNTKLVCYV